MFALIKLICWVAFSFLLALFLIKADLGGQSPMERLEGLWRSPEATTRVAELKGQVESAVADAKMVIARSGQKPREQHTPSEREAVNKLIEKRAGGK